MKVLISIPTLPYGKVTWQLAGWLIHALQQGKRLGCRVIQHFVIGKHGVCSTRNRQIHDFLSTDADVLLCVDDDAVPDMEGFDHLVAAMRRDDVDVCAGWSLMQCDGESGGIPNIFSAHDESANGRFLSPSIAHGTPGLHEIRGGAVGAHVIAIKRKVLEAFKTVPWQWFEDVFHDDPAVGAKFGSRKAGHDLLFFDRAQQLGFRTWLDNRVFWGHVKETDLRDAYRQITSLYDEIASFRHIAEELRQRHGNTDWTAGPVFLMRMAYEAERLGADEACVECGSGLSTAVLRRILGPRVVSLEEDRAFAAQGAQYAPLVRVSDYDWYGAMSLPGRIGLVVCDGPRGSTLGGRYGAMPQLWDRLAPEFTILLDDAHRDGEKAVIERWKKEYGPLDVRVVPDEDGKAFAVITGVKHGERSMVRGSDPADVARDKHVHVHDRMGVAP